MHIRTATATDLPILSRLAIRVFSDTFGHLYPPEDLSAFIARCYHPDSLAPLVGDPTQFWRMVWDGDEAVAYLQCNAVSLPHPEARPDHEGEINRLYIHGPYQGQGLGRQLMNEAFGWLDETYGTAPQWLGVWCDNLKAQALYGSYGFVKVGEYKFPVGKTLDDEFILRRQP